MDPKHCVLTLLRTETPELVLLANSEDKDEMLHYAAFHQGLHCLLTHRCSQGQFQDDLIGGSNLKSGFFCFPL